MTTIISSRNKTPQDKTKKVVQPKTSHKIKDENSNQSSFHNETNKVDDPIKVDDQQQEYMSEQSDTQENNYKIIIAIKSVKEHTTAKVPNIKCTIKIQSKCKSVILPFTEGQFFELSTLSASDQIMVTFTLAISPNIEVGQISIPLEVENVENKESEIIQEFSFPYEHQNHQFTFNGSFYAIILNKSVFLRDHPQPKENQKQKKEKDVQFQSSWDESQGSKSKFRRQPTAGAPSKKLNTESSHKKLEKQKSEAEQLQIQIEHSVRSAIKELKNSQQLQGSESQFQPTRMGLQKAQTIQIVEEGFDGHLSESVQITRQSKKNKNDTSADSSPSPSRLQRKQTFNIDEVDCSSPNRSSNKIKESTRLSDSYDHHCHENLTCLYYIDQASQSGQMKIQNDYLKKVIYALDKRVKSLQIAEEYSKKFQDDMQENDRERTRISDSIQRAQLDNGHLKKQVDKDLQEAIKEKKQLQSELAKKDQEVEQLNSHNKSLQNELFQQKQRNQDLEKKYEENTKLAHLVRDMEQKLQQEHDRADEQAQTFQDKLNQLGDLLDKSNKKRQALDQKIQETNQLQLDTQNHLDNHAIQNEELKQENIKIQNKLLESKHKEINAKLLQEQIQSLQKEVADKTAAKFQSDSVNDQIRKQLQQANIQSQDKEKQFIEKAKELKKLIADLQQTEQQINLQSAEKTKQIIQLKQELKSAQLLAGLSQDIQKQLEEEKARSQYYHQTQQALVLQNQDYSQSIHQMNKQIYIISQKNQELSDKLEQSDSYAQNLKKLICEMQEKDIVCIPYYSDPIDKALANFINCFYDPSMLNGLFVREEEGIYQFGTKKVYIKIEQDKIFIRTGGGFIGLQEFLDLYTPAELEKLQNSGPQAQKAKNDTLTNTIEKRGKMVKEIIHQHKTPLKIKTLGAVFSKFEEEY